MRICTDVENVNIPHREKNAAPQKVIIKTVFKAKKWANSDFFVFKLKIFGRLLVFFILSISAQNSQFSLHPI
jgi:hypothetical protein